MWAFALWQSRANGRGNMDELTVYSYANWIQICAAAAAAAAARHTYSQYPLMRTTSLLARAKDERERKESCIKNKINIQNEIFVTRWSDGGKFTPNRKLSCVRACDVHYFGGDDTCAVFISELYRFYGVCNMQCISSGVPYTENVQTTERTTSQHMCQGDREREKEGKRLS